MTSRNMKKVKFVLGIHNHQPIGNFDFVFEDAYQKSYLPFLKVLEKHPKIRISIHFTGILLDWLEVNHPELIELVNKLCKNNQLEIMSGGYYEPIISVIPEKDRIGQIKKLTEKVKQLFNYDASGMWLAERVWEPTLPGSLSKAGIKYTVVDDTHFKYAGLQDKDLTGYYVTEDLGHSVNLFPINKQLRYTIPFQEPQATIDALREMATEEGQNVMVFADDGEKFGVWPETFKHVYENGWLDNFFTLLEQNLDWIEMRPFNEVMQEVKPKANIYLPTASYSEMMHWSLFKETFKAYEHFEHYLHDQNMYNDVGIFVRGGFWRNFMTKYSEINVMHKKMLRVSNKLAQYEGKKELKEAFDALYAGQCNCPYWHGVFGGLYLSHLRYAIFSNLIKAEKILAKLDSTRTNMVEVCDFDSDGFDELLIENDKHNVYIKPNEGGTVFEYDFKASNKNLLDTMTRREEGYHDKLHHAKLAGQESGGTASIHDLVLAKEEGLTDYLVYDNYERKSFIDHILPQDITAEKFHKNKYTELGDFVSGSYNLLANKETDTSVVVEMERLGSYNDNGNKKELKIHKTLETYKNIEQISASYKISNLSQEKIQLKFAVELNYGLQAGHADDRYYLDKNGKINPGYLDSVGHLPVAKIIGLRDEYMRIDIRLEAEKTNDIIYTPVETISLSEGGFEKVYQSSAVLLVWDLEIENDVTLTFTQKVSRL